MTIEVIVWKNLVNSQHTYVMQCITSSAKDTTKILNTLKGWKQTSCGTNKIGEEIMIFKKNFKDTFAWLEWAKSAPFVIQELDKLGELKRVKNNVK